MAKKKEVVITCNATNVKAVIEGLERGMAALAHEEENLLNTIKQRGYAEDAEKKRLKELEKAILKSELGLTPNSDGNAIRLTIPQLTKERREELKKTVNKKAEEAKVALRNLRRDANEAIKKLEKNKEIAEDESKKGQEDMQKLVDKYVKMVDTVKAGKEKEIMEV